MRGKTNENTDAQTIGSVWCIDRVDKDQHFGIDAMDLRIDLILIYNTDHKPEDTL